MCTPYAYKITTLCYYFQLDIHRALPLHRKWSENDPVTHIIRVTCALHSSRVVKSINNYYYMPKAGPNNDFHRILGAHTRYKKIKPQRCGTMVLFR